MYPVAAAITTGILLVGRPRPAIFLLPVCNYQVQVVVSPLGNKVERISSQEPSLIPITTILDIVGIPRTTPHGATGCPTKKIEEIDVKRFLPQKIFKFGKEPTVS